MSLSARLEQDYITAYKAKDAVRLGVLRLLKTALKNFQVQHLRVPEDGDVFDLIAKQCKQRKESIDQFSAAGRMDLADKERAELEVLQGKQVQQLELRLENLLAGVRESKREQRSKQINQVFDEYRQWVADTMTTEPQPYIRVLAALTR